VLLFPLFFNPSRFFKRKGCKVKHFFYSSQTFQKKFVFLYYHALSIAAPEEIVSPDESNFYSSSQPKKHPPVFISKAGAKVESFLLSTKCFGKKIVTFFQLK
jgi:hypothetical protein